MRSTSATSRHTLLRTLLMSAAFGSCSPVPEPPGAAGDTPTSDTVRVEGRLTDEGVECPALRGTDGRLYTLSTRDLGDARVGDTVVVTATLAEMSFCMQGTTLNVIRLEKR